MNEPLQIILIEDNMSDVHLIEEVLNETRMAYRVT